MTAARAGTSAARIPVPPETATAVSASVAVEQAVESPVSRHGVFRAAWYAVNILLLLSILGVLWSAAWEYSTRRYLKGFSDAIIPVSSSPVQKIQAILDWMSHSPARATEAPDSYSDDRDPIDTLNYASLLRAVSYTHLTLPTILLV